MVPTSDSHYDRAQFGELLALYAALADTTNPLPAAEKKPDAEHLQQLAAAVDKSATAAAAAAKTDADRQRAVAQVAIARYDAAISARRDLKDPAKSIGWLDGFEDRIKSLPNAADFDRGAVVQRVDADMDQGKTADATAQLVPLLKSDPAAGEGLMFDLIHQIDHDLDAAKGANDVAAERQLAANKAVLSGFLVTYAQDSHDPKTHDQLPAYQLYDADSKRQAAELTDDPNARQANLEAALKQYRSLAGGNPDPAVQLGEGLTAFDLGHYKDAIAALSPVMTKVGQPFIDVNGQRSANPQYWGTYYAQLRSIEQVAKSNPNDAAAKTDLTAARQKVAAFFVLYGDKTGGPGHHDEFVQLKADLGAK